MFVSAFAQIEIGKKAPLISVDEWVDNPHEKFRNIEGKAIVLDFWFTHCAPCVYTIPHLNELVKKHEDDSIVFIAITYENRSEIQKFLSKKTFLSNIGIDSSYTIINAYEVKGYPTTFLIDKDGILRWTGHPSHLNTELIDVLLDKKYYPEVKPDDIIQTSNFSGEQDRDYNYPIEVSKNDYMGAASGMQFNTTELSIVNQSLDRVMAYPLQKSESRISIVDTNRYDVRFKLSKKLPQDKVREAIIKSLLNELSMKIETSPTQRNGFDLILSNDSLFINNAINPDKIYYGMGTSTDRTFWKGDGVQIPQLARELENRFETYINDKTNLHGFFEFKIPITAFDDAKNYLLETYRLKLVPARLQIEITEIKNKHNKH
jgi:uncharacterized protein (TIGR03435 family)